MFGINKLKSDVVVLRKKVQIITDISTLEESRELIQQKRIDQLNERIEQLEKDYITLRDKVTAVVEKTEKYDGSVNQALGLLKQVPGLAKS